MQVEVRLVTLNERLLNLAVHTSFLIVHFVDKVNPCSGDSAKTFSDANFGIQKVIKGLKILVGTMKDAREFGCTAVPGAPIPAVGFSDIGKVICTAAVASIKIPLQIILDLTALAFDVADGIFTRVCTPADDGVETIYQNLRQDAIYNNVITVARNGITTFAATQQLKVMLGDVQTGLDADREERDNQRRRRLQSNPCIYSEELDLSSCTCVDTSNGFAPAPCGVISCQDETLLCDGSYNYPLISELVTGKY